MTRDDTVTGIWLMVGTTFVFAVQDGMSQYLASKYNVFLVVMIRYWFFAAFVIALSARTSGGLRKVVRTDQPLVQALRGVLLVAEVCIMIVGFTYLGLVESHAVFVCYPLLVAALSGPILGEKVGWRRWLAIGVGFVGVLIIINPGRGVFSIYALIPLLSATMFAVYGLLNRYVARRDSAATSFFWTGIVGCIVITAIGVWFWEPMEARDWLWMGALCLTGVSGHWLMIKSYEAAEASAIQPFAYLQMPFAVVIGMTVFGESLRASVVVGVSLIVSAGMFTLWRERQHRRANKLL